MEYLPHLVEVSDFSNSGLVYKNPIFIPKKHTVMNYAQQNRLAKKRRNMQKRKSKRKVY